MRVRSESEAGTNRSTVVTGYKAYGTCAQPFEFYPYAGYGYTGSYVDGAWTKTCEDVVIQDFYRRRDRGEIFCNPFTKTFVQTTKTPLNVNVSSIVSKYISCSGKQTYVYDPVYSFYQEGTASPDLLVGSYPSTPSISESTVHDVALTAAWANVSTADVNAWATLAESGETVRSILSITGRIIRVALQLSRGNLRAVWKTFTPKQLEDRWMEGRYAIRPLIYDILGVCRAIQPIVRPERQTFRGSASDSAETSTVILAWSYTNQFRVYTRNATRRTITARGGVLAALQETSTISRWGLDQPFEAIWEVVPFSFVADWFCNVGKVIASWTPNMGIKSLASWVTVENAVLQTKSIDHVDDILASNPNQVSRGLSITGGNVSVLTSIKTRLPNPVRPIIPHMSVRLDAAKLLDLVIMAKKFL